VGQSLVGLKRKKLRGSRYPNRSQQGRERCGRLAKTRTRGLKQRDLGDSTGTREGHEKKLREASESRPNVANCERLPPTPSSSPRTGGDKARPNLAGGTAPGTTEMQALATSHNTDHGGSRPPRETMKKTTILLADTRGLPSGLGTTLIKRVGTGSMGDRSQEKRKKESPVGGPDHRFFLSPAVPEP